VDLGPEVKVQSVKVTGIPSAREEQPGGALSVREGDRFVDQHVADTVASLQRLLHGAGYARAQTVPKVKWDDSTHVSVNFRVTPGAAYVFGDIIVTGADEDLVPLIERVVPTRRGTPYSPTLMADAEKNLLVLGLFRQVRVAIEDAAPDTLDVKVEVVMRETRTVEAALRYWTDAQFQGGARWMHRNLFRRGRGAAVTVFSSKFEQLANFSAWWPAVVGPRSRAVGTIGVDNEVEDSYEALSSGVSMSLRYTPSLLTTLRVGVSIEDVEVIEKSDDFDSFDGQDGLLSALILNAETIDTDGPITPTRGTSSRVSVEWAPNGSISEHHFISVLASGQAYLPLPIRSVLALRLAVGLAEPTGSTLELLPNKRFYSGGASSMRGFNRRKLGPLDSAGAALGGEAKLESSVELRFPLFWRFRGTGFVDAGQVWPTVDLMTTANIEVAVGTGVWLETIVGPLRTDFAYRLTDFQPSEPQSIWHFSIGPAF
jgi:outer membrane protein assembly factor BamA